MGTAEWEEDEWELVNDDGFVYKVKKRLHLDPTTGISAQPLQDPAAAENHRRERKRRALAKLREKCQKEIGQWELLPNTLWAFQQRAQNQQWQEQTTMEMSCDLDVGSPHPPRDSSESNCRRLLDDLILRAEADEAIIQYVYNLCEMAEAVCNVHKKHMKQSFVDLPVWASPRQLMASLCDE